MRITLFRLVLILLLGALTIFLFLNALPYLGLATLITTLYLYWRQYAYEAHLKGEILAIHQQGKAYFEQANYTEAIATFDVVLNKYDARIWIFGEFSQTAEAYLYRGTSYKYLDETDKALADYNRAIRLRPRWAQSHISKGIFYELGANWVARL
ncbi:MAG: tetratricopeptide repeat protein [Cyanobacteria bacterium J06626_18]